jgi:lipoprotein-anchoring transpeptidase ErfK/SrfK
MVAGTGSNLMRGAILGSTFAGVLGMSLAALPSVAASAPLAMADQTNPAARVFDPFLHDQQSTDTQAGDDQAGYQLPAELRRQVVAYPTQEQPGTVVIDTANTYLYYVLGGGRALRYGIGVGREGFAWAGVQKVSRKAEWPDWVPPPEMIQRQQYLPRWVAGGPGNPLGARAMYLGNSEYRIHGTNDPSTIGQKVSSGCIRLTNEDVTDLYSRVKLGAKVVVLAAPQQRSREIARTDAGANSAGVAARRGEAVYPVATQTGPNNYSISGLY